MRLIRLTGLFAFIMLCFLIAASTVGAKKDNAAGEKMKRVRHSVKSLNLKRVPTEAELMAAGQLGGQLYPTAKIKNDKQAMQHNLEFGQAIELWNKHEYKKAVQLFRAYVRKYPDSPWTDEALLHVGCDARYNGRYDEAEANFRAIIEKNKNANHEGARQLTTKAKTRLGVLKVLQNDFAEAKQHFREVKQQGASWRERTYASHWLQRISLYEGDQKETAKCGVQALAAIMEKDGRQESAHQVTQERPLSLKGHSIARLRDIAAVHGYQLDVRRIEADGLKRMPLPAIVQISNKNESGSGHYWVLESIKADELTLFDPQSSGRFRQTVEEFAAQWNGIILFRQRDGQSLPGFQLSEADTAELFGGCCGARRAESGLGGAGANAIGGIGGGDSPCGSPVWKVNMVNMNLFMTDIPMWSNNPIGPDVYIRLSYNSQATTAYHEPFGNKWQFNYATYLVVDTGGNVTVFMPDGRRDVYVPDGQGGYTRPYQVYNTLTKIAENHFELRFLDDTVYEYDIPAGTGSLQPFLVQIRDPHGQSLTFGYNDNVELATITDALGRITRLAYTAQGLIERIDDPFGRTALFEYDGEHNLTKITDMAGYWFRFTYDPDAYLTGIEDQKGTTHFWVEPADGVVANSDNYPPPGDSMWQNYRITVTYPDSGKEEFFYYGGTGLKSWHVSPNHYVPWQSQQINNFRVNTPKTFYLHTRTGNGQRAEVGKITYPDGTYLQYGFDTVTGLRTSQRTPEGTSISRTFNAMGRAASLTDVRGNVTTYTYSANEIDLLTIENSLGTITMTYNDRHQVTSITDRLNQTTSLAYNSYGQLQSITDAAGVVTEYLYNNHYLQEVHHDGKTIESYLRDPIGRAISITDATGLNLQLAYNDLNHLTTVTYPDNKTTTYTYSSCCPRMLDSVTDRAGRTIFFEYDAMNNRTAVINPASTATRFRYDANRNLTELIDPNTNKTRFEYDAYNRLTRKIFADSAVLTYIYDSFGRLGRRTDARGIAADSVRCLQQPGRHNLFGCHAGHRLSVRRP